MNVGYHVVSPPHYGYGEKGFEDYVPGSAVLHMDVKVKQYWQPMDEMIVAEECKQEIDFKFCNKVL